MGKEFKELPSMRVLRQRYSIPPAVDLPSEIEREWESLRDNIKPAAGRSVAVAVGSRGISGLPTIVAEVVKRLKDAGLKPFITPAMGSHGGATAEGKRGTSPEGDNRGNRGCTCQGHYGCCAHGRHRRDTPISQ